MSSNVDNFDIESGEEIENVPHEINGCRWYIILFFLFIFLYLYLCLLIIIYSMGFKL